MILLAGQIGGEPELGELLVIEVGGERAGAMRWRLESERNRIAHFGGIAVHPPSAGVGSPTTWRANCSAG